jgi:hypothetical protein
MSEEPRLAGAVTMRRIKQIISDFLTLDHQFVGIGQFQFVPSTSLAATSAGYVSMLIAAGERTFANMGGS